MRGRVEAVSPAAGGPSAGAQAVPAAAAVEAARKVRRERRMGVTSGALVGEAASLQAKRFRGRCAGPRPARPLGRFPAYPDGGVPAHPDGGVPAHPGGGVPAPLPQYIPTG
ncbi:hypothetical protein GCM10027075_10130 [Streptomyces heilongjiangensis]